MKNRLFLSMLYKSLVLSFIFLLISCRDGSTDTSTSPDSSVGISTTPAPQAGASSSDASAVEIAPALPGQVLYQDDFTNVASGWPLEQEFENYYLGYHEPEFYHVEVHAPGDRAVVPLPNHQFSDFTVESDVSVSVDNTDTNGNFIYGLTIRRSGNFYYAFVISPLTQNWQVLKSDPQRVTVLDQGNDSSLMGLVRNDTLRIDAVGPEMTFYVNGQVVSQLTDSDYTNGEIGFFNETIESTQAHIHFDAIKVGEWVESSSAPVSQDETTAVFYDDDFTDTASGWPTELEFDNAYFGYHEPDYYHVEVSVPSDRKIVSLPDHQFDNFTVESNVFVWVSSSDISGEFIYGLIARRSGNFYYAFVISPFSKRWQILKSEPSGLTTLAEGNDTSIQGFVQSDLLRIDAEGSDLAFHINGHMVEQLNDPSFTVGEIGFYVETQSSTLAHIHFDSLTVRPAELVQSTVTIQSNSTQTAPAPTAIAVPQGMILIPGGTFLMGSSNGPENEQPEHAISLSTFFIDQFEVSNAQYLECVRAGGCSQTAFAHSYTRPSYRNNPDYEHHPVIGVTWSQAVAYCAWANKRLPTEAEWEYAASGPNNYIWPWGNEFDPQLSAASARDTQQVTSYPEGATPSGVYNMAGNVLEWVQDAFSETFYANSPTENPVGPGDGALHIFRGGSFDNLDGSAFTTSRRYVKPGTTVDVDIGFRCAQGVPPNG